MFIILPYMNYNQGKGSAMYGKKTKVSVGLMRFPLVFTLGFFRRTRIFAEILLCTVIRAQVRTGTKQCVLWLWTFWRHHNILQKSNKRFLSRVIHKWNVTACTPQLSVRLKKILCTYHHSTTSLWNKLIRQKHMWLYRCLNLPYLILKK